MEKNEKLPVRFKAKWVKALRSGKYKQGRNVMYSKNAKTFCCIGVACHVLGVSLEDMANKAFPSHSSTIDLKKLPAIFRLSGRDFNAESPRQRKPLFKLAYMNDTKHKTFAEIADYIEANL